MHLICSHIFVVAVNAGGIGRNSREMKVISQQGWSQRFRVSPLTGL